MNRIHLSNLRNLTEVTMEDIPRCSRPPPLALFPHLQRAVLRKMASITRFGTIDLTGGDTAAFNRLSKFTLEIDDMESLEEFNTKYYIQELVIQKCPKLCFVPLPPRAGRLVISNCNKVLVADGEHGPCTSAPVTELVVKSCKVALRDWNLLHHLPGLHSLTVNNCYDYDLINTPDYFEALSSLQSLCFSRSKMYDIPDGFQRIASLRSMHLSDCNRITSLPGWLGDLTALQKLAIDRCHAIGSLPGSIQKLINLKDLHISDCPKLKEWCESDKMLAHIRPKYGEHGTSRPACDVEPAGDVEEDCSDDMEAWESFEVEVSKNLLDDVKEARGKWSDDDDDVERYWSDDVEEVAEAVRDVAEELADDVEEEVAHQPRGPVCLELGLGIGTAQN